MFQNLEEAAAALTNLRLTHAVRAELPRMVLEALKHKDREVATKYSFRLCFMKEGQHRKHGTPFYFDDRHALVLFYESKAVACASFHFGVEGKRKTEYIKITQIQGCPFTKIKRVHGRRVLVDCPYLPLLRIVLDETAWEDLLVALVVHLARAFGSIKQVQIQRAYDNAYWRHWTSQMTGKLGVEARAKNERLKRRYDRTAERCGFVLLNRRYVLKL